MSRYVTQKGPDNITWLSLEPFLEDLKESIIILMDMNLPLDEEQGRNEKLLGLKATFELLSAVVQESNLAKLRNHP